MDKGEISYDRFSSKAAVLFQVFLECALDLRKWPLRDYLWFRASYGSDEAQLSKQSVKRWPLAVIEAAGALPAKNKFIDSFFIEIYDPEFALLKPSAQPGNYSDSVADRRACEPIFVEVGNKHIHVGT